MQQTYSLKNNLFVSEYDTFYKPEPIEPEPVEGEAPKKKKKKKKEEAWQTQLHHKYDLPPCGKIEKKQKEKFESIFDD